MDWSRWFVWEGGQILILGHQQRCTTSRESIHSEKKGKTHEGCNQCDFIEDRDKENGRDLVGLWQGCIMDCGNPPNLYKIWEC